MPISHTCSRSVLKIFMNKLEAFKRSMAFLNFRALMLMVMMIMLVKVRTYFYGSEINVCST